MCIILLFISDDYTKPPSDGGEDIPTDKPPDYEPWVPLLLH